MSSDPPIAQTLATAEQNLITIIEACTYV